MHTQSWSEYKSQIDEDDSWKYSQWIQSFEKNKISCLVTRYFCSWTLARIHKHIPYVHYHPRPTSSDTATLSASEAHRREPDLATPAPLHRRTWSDTRSDTPESIYPHRSAFSRDTSRVWANYRFSRWGALLYDLLCARNWALERAGTQSLDGPWSLVRVELSHHSMSGMR